MIIRFASPKDKDFVVDFTRNTWEHGDYIESVWDVWVNDSLGKLFVAEVDKKPVGIMHVTLLTPDYAWMDGARVHQDYRRMGVATELNKACMKWAKDMGAKKIGLLIMENNYPAQKAAEKIGFRLIAQWVFEQVDVNKFELDEEIDISTVRIANSSDFKNIIDFLTASEGYKKVGGLFAWHYKVLPLDKRFIIQEIENDRVFITEDNKSEEITAIGFQEFHIDWKTHSLSLYFGYLDGKSEDMYKIVHKAYSLLRENHPKMYRLCMPATEEAKALLDNLPLSKDLGYLRIYEKEL